MADFEDEKQQPEEVVETNSETTEVSQIPTVQIPLSKDVTYKIGIDNSNKVFSNALGFSVSGTKIQIGTDATIVDNKPNLKFSGSCVRSDDNYDLYVNIVDNNGTLSGSATASVNGFVGKIQANANGNFTLDENGDSNHNFDASASTNIGSSEWTANIHNDRTDTSISVNGRRPLLRRDNNPNSNQAIYQEQKEQLEQTGDRYSVAIKGGYSNEDAGFYTTNSIMANLGKGNFLNLKFDMSKYKSSAELMADLKKFILQYKNSNNESEEGIKTKSQGIDLSYKGKKNIYTANWSVETQNADSDEAVKNVSFGAKASLNRTQFGEFNSGLNGEIEANITSQGYKFGVDGAYNYYGNEHDGTNDYMVSSKTTIEKNNDGTNFETGLYGAIRFNNCSTIIEPHSIFEVKKDTNGDVTKAYYNGIGIYQQLGKNFEDLTAYIKGERVIFDGGDKQNYSQILAGLKKKATDKVTLNAEGSWHSIEGCSGNIGVVINF